MVERVKTACRACHGGCGALVTVDKGTVVKIEPDQYAPMSKGRMCPKGLAGIELLYHPDRLKHPQKRVGERGEGQWAQVSWNEAYDMIVDKLETVKRDYGAQSIAIANGTGRHHYNHVIRFAHVLGTPNWFEPGGAQCFFPRVTNGLLTYGHPLINDYYGETNPECILVWGSDPITCSDHGTSQFLVRDAIKKGSKLIVVDPRKTELAQKAEVWLQLRPGTDCALALSMLQVIINEELFDKDFVENWVHGFDKLRERVQDYSPDRVSQITWVPAEDIKRAARIYAGAHPAALELGCALEHTPNSFDSVRAISFLPGLTGNYDIPGGFIKGTDILPPVDGQLDQVAPALLPELLGAEEFSFLSGADSASPMAHDSDVFEAMLTQKPYPIKAMLIFGNNSLMAFADSKKTYEALQRVDFLCCMDLFMTPTAEICDLVLPAACWLEVDEAFSVPFFANYAVLAQKKIVRTHECKADEEVIIDLCKRMGLDYGGTDIKSILDSQLKEMGNRFEQFKGMDFARLCEENYLTIMPEYKNYEKQGGLDTPTGKMEVWSTKLEKRGYDPLPSYNEPPESPLSQPTLAEEFPLILYTGNRVQYFFQSENFQLPSLRKQHPYPRVEIHPDTAAEYDIKEGNWVYIESPRGRITQKASVTNKVDPRTVCCQHGWWYPEERQPEHGWRESNVNMLSNAGPPYNPVIGTYQLRPLLCKIYKNEDRPGEEG